MKNGVKIFKGVQNSYLTRTYYLGYLNLLHILVSTSTITTIQNVVLFAGMDLLSKMKKLEYS